MAWGSVDEWQPLAPLTTQTGLPIDKLNYVMCLLLAYPLALVFRLLPHSMATLRHVLGGSLGLAFGYFCFRESVMLVVFQASMCWLLMKIGGKHQHKLVMSFAMLFLIAAHAYRQYYFYKIYLLDVTGPMMILTQKVTQLSFSVYDGCYRKPESLSHHQGVYATLKIPTILEFFGHVFIFTGFLAGPNHQFHDYIVFIEGRGEQGKPPSALFISMRKMLFSFCCIAITFVPAAAFQYDPSMELLIHPNFVASHSLLKRVGHMILASVVIRCNYYFAWILADGANNVAGLGFLPGKNHKGTWDHISNVNVANVEFATSFKMVLDNWNIQTQRWLKYVCYDRTNSVYITMALSALWHGLYPGYYLTFLFGAFITEASRKVRHNVRPFFMSAEAEKTGSKPLTSRIYDVLTWAVTMCYLDYCVGPFVVLELLQSINLWSHFYYGGQVFVLLALLLLPGKKKSKPAAGEKKTK